MKKIILGSVVGGIILFVIQSLSWTVLDLHRPANQYTPKQNEILSYLGSQITDEGQYFLPTYPAGSSMDEGEKLMKESIGKPWAIVAYHKEMKDNMLSSIIRVLLLDIIMIGLLCWILSKFLNPRFSTVFVATLLVGLIVFINIPYTTHVFYHTFDVNASLIDAVAGWGLTGLWLGWIYSRKSKTH